MIDSKAYMALCAEFSALSGLSDKVGEILRDELSPQETLRGAWAMSVGKVPGALVLSERRLIAVYTMRLLFFFNLPAVQEFDLGQLRRCELEPQGVYLRASASEDSADEDYEENRFILDAGPRAELLEALQPLCPALT
jgi:hypothetical protein